MFKIKNYSLLLLITLLLLQTFRGNAQMKKMDKMEMKERKMSNIPQSPEDISPLLIGEKIPDASLKDNEGNAKDLSELIQKQPTILVFYRGGWCPYCTLQLSGLQEIKPWLDSMHIQLVAVSTDSPDNLSKSMMKQKLDYTLLSDADTKLAQQFGIAYHAPKNYEKMLPTTTGGMDTDLLLPVPSVFVLDKKGMILFEYINPDFKQRMDPQLL
ncbi:MAG: antioxidant AhpC, partial [Pseudopedobacter saltans]